MSKSPTDNNIPQDTVSVEDVLDDNIAIKVSHVAKTDMIVVARRERDWRGKPMTVSQWGRKVLMAALAEDRRSGEDRRRTA